MTEASPQPSRIVFLDYLRFFACLMVMLVHSCEPFYFNDAGELCFRSAGDAFWACWIDSAVRAAVPLFVMASAYLLLPLRIPAGEFFRRRLVRVVVPFALWCAVYIVFGGFSVRDGFDWRAIGANFGRFLFNFPMTTGGHLWFVPMLLGLYLLMPILSPWAERASEREVRGWLALWLFTTALPFVRKLWAVLFASGADAVSGQYWAHAFGLANFDDIPFLWGECGWNGFGALYYASGFVGYLLLGLYFRKFAPASGRRTLALAVPLWLAGYAIVGSFFYFRIPGGGEFPVTRPYAAAVDLETSWEFCSLGVALTVAAYFLVLRRFQSAGGLYRRLVRPFAEASYCTYLLHMLILSPVHAALRPHVPTPACIVLTALVTFVAASLAAMALRRVPGLGRWVG